MRALYFTDTWPPQVNGVSVVTHLSVLGLRARGWDVSVVAPRYPVQPDVFGAAADPVALAVENEIHLAVIGPEAPLTAGLADRLRQAGLELRQSEPMSLEEIFVTTVRREGVAA